MKTVSENIAANVSRIVVSGCGLGGVIALHVAALWPRISSVVIWDALSSIQTLIDCDDWKWPDYAFSPGILQHYDLSDLMNEIPCPVHVINPLDGVGCSSEKLSRLNSGICLYENFTSPDQILKTVLEERNSSR